MASETYNDFNKNVLVLLYGIWELFLQLLQYFMANCESYIWILQIEWKLKFVFVSVLKRFKNYILKILIPMKNVNRKIWFHEFQRECSTKKKAKIDKKTRDKIYDDEKRARTFVPT